MGGVLGRVEGRELVAEGQVVAVGLDDLGDVVAFEGHGELGEGTDGRVAVREGGLVVVDLDGFVVAGDHVDIVMGLFEDGALAAQVREVGVGIVDEVLGKEEVDGIELLVAHWCSMVGKGGCPVGLVRVVDIASGSGASMPAPSGRADAGVCSVAVRSKGTAGMGQELSGKVAVVTGGASGIGRATAELFAGEGAKVVIADVADEEGGEAGGRAGRRRGLPADRRGRRRRGPGAGGLGRGTFGGLHVMVNNAGISSSFRRFLRDDLRDFDRVMGVNLFGVIIGTQRAGRHMAEHGGGSIINTSSIGGLTGGGPPIVYRTSKAAIVQFSRMVATDLAEYGVRVNCIAPGHIPTGITSYDLGPTIEADQPLQRQGRRRCGRGHAVPGRDRSAQITGIVVPVDGGTVAGRPCPSPLRDQAAAKRLSLAGQRLTAWPSRRPPSVPNRLLDQPDDPGDPLDGLARDRSASRPPAARRPPRSRARRAWPPPASGPRRATAVLAGRRRRAVPRFWRSVGVDQGGIERGRARSGMGDMVEDLGGHRGDVLELAYPPVRYRPPVRAGASRRRAGPARSRSSR